MSKSNRKMYLNSNRFMLYYYSRFTALLDFVRDRRVNQYQKGKTRKAKPIWIYWTRDSGSGISSAYANLHLTQTDNHASIPPLSFLQAGCPSCRLTNSVKALKAKPFYGVFAWNFTICSKLKYTRSLASEVAPVLLAVKSRYYRCR